LEVLILASEGQNCNEALNSKAGTSNAVIDPKDIISTNLR